jgi:5-methyltetrahydropteroyltriglutamate--homocysteine methyltransferase
MSMQLQTTIAGSLPAVLARAAQPALAPWLLEGERPGGGKRDVAAGGARSGTGLRRHYDRRRTECRHFVTTFIENLDGVDFEHKKTVRIRDRYDADADGRRRSCAPPSGVRRGREVPAQPDPAQGHHTLRDR